MLPVASFRPFRASTPRAMRDLVRLALTALVLAGGLGAGIAAPAAATAARHQPATTASAAPQATGSSGAPGSVLLAAPRATGPSGLVASTGLPTGGPGRPTTGPAVGGPVVADRPAGGTAADGVRRADERGAAAATAPAPATARPLPDRPEDASTGNGQPAHEVAGPATDPARDATGRRGPPRR